MARTTQTVQDAGLTFAEIDEIYPVGGGSTMPLVVELLEKMTGKKVSRRCEPHSAAALGAVLAGRIEYERQGRVYTSGSVALPPPGVILHDILSHSIGVMALNEDNQEVCAPILPKSTPIPSIQTKLFKLSEPNQTAATIQILQGEDGQRASDCLILGHFDLNDLPARPDVIGRIEVTFSLDSSGLLSAKARDNASGATAELEIDYEAGSGAGARTVAEGGVIICHRSFFEGVIDMNYLNMADRVQSGGDVETTVTLVDESPSMDEQDLAPTRRAAAIKANIKLAEVKAQHHPDDRIGVIAFSATARVLLAPVVVKGSLPDLRRALREADGGSGTNFTAALEMAEECLFPSRSWHPARPVSRMLSGLLFEMGVPKGTGRSQGPCPADGAKRIVLLSDGDHNTGPSPVAVASRLKRAGVVIDCIGIGGNPESVDEGLLKEIASRNPDGSIRYCFIGDSDALLKKYQDLAHHIRCV